MSKKGAIRNMPLTLIRSLAADEKTDSGLSFYLPDNIIFSVQVGVLWWAEKSERGHEKWAR
jgi:hypothetical protein